MEWAAVKEIIENAHRFAVIGHKHPDADAIGSICATVAALENLGKHAIGCIGEPSAISPNLLTIPGAKNIQNLRTLPDVDVVILVDCATVDRAGDLAEQVSVHKSVLVIDHHTSNPRFGHVNLIDTEAESTTTILGELFELLGVTITSDIAYALYAGLVTDTGSFRWGRPHMHELAARLMHSGVNIRQVAVDLLDVNRVDDVLFLGKVLSNLVVHSLKNYTLAVLVADYNTVQGYPINSTERLVDFVRSLDGVDIGAVLKEYSPGDWSVSLRSRHVPVSEIALGLGGGGHMLAAGYSAYGSQHEVFAQLVEFLETYNHGEC